MGYIPGQSINTAQQCDAALRSVAGRQKDLVGLVERCFQNWRESTYTGENLYDRYPEKSKQDVMKNPGQEYQQENGLSQQILSKTYKGKKMC